MFTEVKPNTFKADMVRTKGKGKNLPHTLLIYKEGESWVWKIRLPSLQTVRKGCCPSYQEAEDAALAWLEDR